VRSQAEPGNEALPRGIEGVDGGGGAADDNVEGVPLSSHDGGSEFANRSLDSAVGGSDWESFGRRSCCAAVNSSRFTSLVVCCPSPFPEIIGSTTPNIPWTPIDTRVAIQRVKLGGFWPEFDK